MNSPVDPVDALLSSLHPGEGHRARIEQLPVQRWVADTQPAKRGLPFEWVDQFRHGDDDMQQVVEGVIAAAQTSIWYGESNSGKTYMVLHLAYCVSTGKPFFGKRVEHGAVVYIAGESAGSIRRRVTAFEKHHCTPFGAFGLVSTALNLMDPSADVEDLIDLVREKASDIGEQILLIVVDTVARAMGGANENASEDMSRLVSAFDRIREETGAHVLGIHHTGKDSGKGARGHSSLRAAVDTEVEVTADDASKTHTGHITKQRDLPTKGARFHGRFVSVDVGRDQWQGVVTACAVDDTEATPAGRQKAMGAAQQAVLAYLAGRDKGDRRAAIVKVLEEQGVARARAYRAINELLEAQLVEHTAGLIYRPRE